MEKVGKEQKEKVSTTIIFPQSKMFHKALRGKEILSELLSCHAGCHAGARRFHTGNQPSTVDTRLQARHKDTYAGEGK
jgi:hypothetical protein